MSTCRQGHTFDGAVTLACPTCAQDASSRMLIEFLERAIRNRERVFRVLDHCVIGPDYWRRVLREQGVSLTELEVPALCGAAVGLSEIGRQVGRVHKAIQEEQPNGKCRKCEARLAALQKNLDDAAVEP